ncbi:MAG: hypothetical protein M0R37_14365 [Bacteroidales bacterium]|nr:hypothetical protein [Bacteroidales bacterium]
MAEDKGFQVFATAIDLPPKERRVLCERLFRLESLAELLIPLSIEDLALLQILIKQRITAYDRECEAVRERNRAALTAPAAWVPPRP